MFKLANGLPVPSVVCLLPMLFAKPIRSSGFLGMITLMFDVLLNCYFEWELRETMLPSCGSIPAMGYQGPAPADFPFFGKDCVDFCAFCPKTVILRANVEVSHPKVELLDATVEQANPPVAVSDTPVVEADAIVEPANSTTALSLSPILPANPKVNELDSTVKATNMQAVKLDSKEELLYPPEQETKPPGQLVNPLLQLLNQTFQSAQKAAEYCVFIVKKDGSSRF